MAREIPPKFPRPGDMVTPIFSSQGLDVWESWGKTEMLVGPLFKILEGEMALVLEDCLDRGGNGSKIITTSGRTGWVNANYIARI